MRCEHERFESTVSVNRLVDAGLAVTAFTADVSIRCVDCGAAAEFFGLPGGVDPDRPTSSVDARELRAPFRLSRPMAASRVADFVEPRSFCTDRLCRLDGERHLHEPYR